MSNTDKSDMFLGFSIFDNLRCLVVCHSEDVLIPRQHSVWWNSVKLSQPL